MIFVVEASERSVTAMDHDYAHCRDYRKDCPEECFRARLTKEAIEIHYNSPHMTWFDFAGTEVCKRKEREGNG